MDIIGNKCTKFYGKRLSPSENIVKSRRGATFFDSPCIPQRHGMLHRQGCDIDTMMSEAVDMYYIPQMKMQEYHHPQSNITE